MPRIREAAVIRHIQQIALAVIALCAKHCCVISHLKEQPDRGIDLIPACIDALGLTQLIIHRPAYAIARPTPSHWKDMIDIEIAHGRRDKPA